MPDLPLSDNPLDSVRLETGEDERRRRAAEETSDEHFDRAAFARRALAVLGTPKTTVAICEGTGRVFVETGRVWGRGAKQLERWAMLGLSPTASRRAIVLAAAEVARAPRAYALDLLLRGPWDS